MIGSVSKTEHFKVLRSKMAGLISSSSHRYSSMAAGFPEIFTLFEAYHWCPDYDLASAEFARMLASNGTVACIWNLEDR